MSAGSKLSMALFAAVLALGLAACGGDDDSGSNATTGGAAAQDREAQEPKDEGAGGGGDDRIDSGSGDDGSGSDGSGEGGDGSKDFVPRQHEDSGGGSDEYVVRGGDNSVQEFGTEADEAERDAAAAALHNFLDARAQGAWDAACSYVSSDVRESLEMFAVKAREAAKEQGRSVPQDTGCASLLASLTNRAVLPELRKEAAQADVRSLRVEGDRAFVIYTDGKGTVIAIPVAKEGDEWKVGSLAGTPLT